MQAYFWFSIKQSLNLNSDNYRQGFTYLKVQWNIKNLDMLHAVILCVRLSAYHKESNTSDSTYYLLHPFNPVISKNVSYIFKSPPGSHINSFENLWL